MALTRCVLVAEDVSLRAANRASAEATALSMLESVKAAMEKFYAPDPLLPGILVVCFLSFFLFLALYRPPIPPLGCPAILSFFLPYT